MARRVKSKNTKRARNTRKHSIKRGGGNDKKLANNNYFIHRNTKYKYKKNKEELSKILERLNKDKFPKVSSIFPKLHDDLIPLNLNWFTRGFMFRLENTKLTKAHQIYLKINNLKIIYDKEWKKTIVQNIIDEYSVKGTVRDGVRNVLKKSVGGIKSMFSKVRDWTKWRPFKNKKGGGYHKKTKRKMKRVRKRGGGQIKNSRNKLLWESHFKNIKSPKKGGGVAKRSERLNKLLGKGGITSEKYRKSNYSPINNIIDKYLDGYSGELSYSKLICNLIFKYIENRYKEARNKSINDSLDNGGNWKVSDFMMEYKNDAYINQLKDICNIEEFEKGGIQSVKDYGQLTAKKLGRLTEDAKDGLKDISHSVVNKGKDMWNRKEELWSRNAETDDTVENDHTGGGWLIADKAREIKDKGTSSIRKTLRNIKYGNDSDILSRIKIELALFLKILLLKDKIIQEFIINIDSRNLKKLIQTLTSENKDECYSDIEDFLDENKRKFNSYVEGMEDGKSSFEQDALRNGEKGYDNLNIHYFKNKYIESHSGNSMNWYNYNCRNMDPYLYKDNSGNIESWNTERAELLLEFKEEYLKLFIDKLPILPWCSEYLDEVDQISLQTIVKETLKGFIEYPSSETELEIASQISIIDDFNTDNLLIPEVEVKFSKPGSLGIYFEGNSEEDQSPYVIGVNKDLEAASKTVLVKAKPWTLRLREVGNTNISQMNFDEAIALIGETTERPLTLTFDRVPVPAGRASGSNEIQYGGGIPAVAINLLAFKLGNITYDELKETLKWSDISENLYNFKDNTKNEELLFLRMKEKYIDNYINDVFWNKNAPLETIVNYEKQILNNIKDKAYSAKGWMGDKGKGVLNKIINSSMKLLNKLGIKNKGQQDIQEEPTNSSRGLGLDSIRSMWGIVPVNGSIMDKLRIAWNINNTINTVNNKEEFEVPIEDSSEEDSVGVFSETDDEINILKAKINYYREYDTEISTELNRINEQYLGLIAKYEVALVMIIESCSENKHIKNDKRKYSEDRASESRPRLDKYPINLENIPNPVLKTAMADSCGPQIKRQCSDIEILINENKGALIQVFKNFVDPLEELINALNVFKNIHIENSIKYKQYTETLNDIITNDSLNDKNILKHQKKLQNALKHIDIKIYDWEDYLDYTLLHKPWSGTSHNVPIIRLKMKDTPTYKDLVPIINNIILFLEKIKSDIYNYNNDRRFVNTFAYASLLLNKDINHLGYVEDNDFNEYVKRFNEIVSETYNGIIEEYSGKNIYELADERTNEGSFIPNFIKEKGKYISDEINRPLTEEEKERLEENSARDSEKYDKKFEHLKEGRILEAMGAPELTEEEKERLEENSARDSEKYDKIWNIFQGKDGGGKYRRKNIRKKTKRKRK